MRFIKWLVLGLFAFFLIVFAVGNRQLVEIHLFPFGIIAETPVFVFFFLSIMLGILMGGIGLLMGKVKHAWQDRGLKKKISALEDELAAVKLEKNMASDSPKALIKS